MYNEYIMFAIVCEYTCLIKECIYTIKSHNYSHINLITLFKILSFCYLIILIVHIISIIIEFANAYNQSFSIQMLI